MPRRRSTADSASVPTNLGSDPPSTPGSAPTTPQDTDPSPSNDVVEELVDQYFRYLHAMPAYSFLHQATVVKRCREKTINDALKLALCAITAQMLGRYENRRDRWARTCEQLILDRIDRPSIFQLQSLLLVIRYRAEAGQFGRAFMFSGIAARSAVALRLNYEHPELGPVAQEVRRRTFWSLYLLEDVFCCGLKEFELCRPDIIYLQLPREDAYFGISNELSTGFLQPTLGLEPATVGARGLFIKLALMRRKIMKLNRQINLKEIHLSDLFASVEQLQSDLHRISSQTGPHDRYPPLDPDSFQWQPHCVMMHMSFHQCHCDLYRNFLRGLPEAAPKVTMEGVKPAEVAAMGARSLENAEWILRILSDYDRHAGGQQLLDWDAAICAYQAARLVLFGAYKGNETSMASVQVAINKAQHTLDIISRRFAFSVPVQSMRRDLTKLIQRYKGLITRSSNSELVFEADQGLRAPTGVSKAAGTRQNLSVHSLLLRSDFVDDSREAAMEPPRSATPEPPPVDWTDSTLATQALQSQGGWIPATTNFSLGSAFPDPNLTGMFEGAAFDFSVWPEVPGTYELPGVPGVGGSDEQYMY